VSAHCLCCGGDVDVIRFRLVDGRLYDVCERCALVCDECSRTVNGARRVVPTAAEHIESGRLYDAVERARKQRRRERRRAAL